MEPLPANHQLCSATTTNSSCSSATCRCGRPPGPLGPTQSLPTSHPPHPTSHTLAPNHPKPFQKPVPLVLRLLQQRLHALGLAGATKAPVVIHLTGRRTRCTGAPSGWRGPERGVPKARKWALWPRWKPFRTVFLFFRSTQVEVRSPRQGSTLLCLFGVKLYRFLSLKGVGVTQWIKHLLWDDQKGGHMSKLFCAVLNEGAVRAAGK